MRIASSDIVMTSSRSYVQKHEKSERLRVWVDNPAGTSAGLGPGRQTDSSTADSAALTGRPAAPSRVKGHPGTGDNAPGSTADGKLLVLKGVIEAITGKRLVLLDALGNAKTIQQVDLTV